MKLLPLAVVALLSLSAFAQKHETANAAPRHAAAGENAFVDSSIAAGNRTQAAQEKQLAELEHRGAATHVKPAAPPKTALKLPAEKAQHNPPIDFTYHPAKAQNAHAGNANNSGYRK